MVRLFRLNIPAAVAAVLDLAIRIERTEMSVDHWLTLAQEIEEGKFITELQVSRLVAQYPFLREFRQ